jgi:hypothetical protein
MSTSGQKSLDELQEVLSWDVNVVIIYWLNGSLKLETLKKRMSF